MCRCVFWSQCSVTLKYVTCLNNRNDTQIAFSWQLVLSARFCNYKSVIILLAFLIFPWCWALSKARHSAILQPHLHAGLYSHTQTQTPWQWAVMILTDTDVDWNAVRKSMSPLGYWCNDWSAKQESSEQRLRYASEMAELCEGNIQNPTSPHWVWADTVTPSCKRAGLPKLQTDNLQSSRLFWFYLWLYLI